MGHGTGVGPGNFCSSPIMSTLNEIEDELVHAQANVEQVNWHIAVLAKAKDNIEWAATEVSCPGTSGARADWVNRQRGK